MKSSSLLLALLAPLALAACDPYGGTVRPDYAIRVTPTPQGGVAQAPACPTWAAAEADPYDNQLFPQYGCADARNLAAMVERPDDLVDARALGPERGVTAVGAVRRYDNNQTRGLITPGTETSQQAVTTSPAASSPMTGDVTGSASSGASPAPAAAP